MRKDALLLMREMGTSQSSVPVWLIKYCEIAKNLAQTYSREAKKTLTKIQ